jgi:succinyl-CoA synthetase alpha subunit
MAILVDKNSKIVIQGITGREASMVTKHALAYGTKIMAGVTPGKEGQNVEGVPVFDTLKRACKEFEINTSVVYVPPAFAYDAVMEAIGNGIALIVIMTERIPQQDAVRFLSAAKQNNCMIVGPNSVGVITPADKVKLGAIGGDNRKRRDYFTQRWNDGRVRLDGKAGRFRRNYVCQYRRRCLHRLAAKKDFGNVRG